MARPSYWLARQGGRAIDTLRVRERDQAPPLSSYPVEQARRAFRALSQLAVERAGDLPAVSVTEIEVPGGDGARSAFVYRPASPGLHPTVAFFHGGGFAIGDSASYDLPLRTLCVAADAVVVSVDYRLAPEHPFPASIQPPTCSASGRHWRRTPAATCSRARTCAGFTAATRARSPICRTPGSRPCGPPT